jgi:hypothetical protein
MTSLGVDQRTEGRDRQRRDDPDNHQPGQQFYQGQPLLFHERLPLRAAFKQTPPQQR